MRDHVMISPPNRPIKGIIGVPTSKSISNRALIMGSLGGFRPALHALSDADDTERMDRLLNDRPLTMDCGAGGTTFRFLLAWAAIQDGEDRIISGIPRLLERPHTDLVIALNSIGGSIESIPEGFRVRGRKLSGGKIDLRSPKSSQFITALLLIAPYLENGIQLNWSGRRSSEPYVQMTCRLMQQFGVEVKISGDAIIVPPGSYSTDRFVVPGDWSAASFWYQIVALSPGSEVELIGLQDDDLQGDAKTVDLWRHWVMSERTEAGILLKNLRPMLKLGRFKFNLKRTPDLFQPLALTCAATGVRGEISGLETLPLKETDRIKATEKVLSSFGGSLKYNGGSCMIEPMDLDRSPHADRMVDPEGDHRVAMSAAPLALLAGKIGVLDPHSVNKSYPLFWDHLEQAGFSIEHSTH